MRLRDYQKSDLKEAHKLLKKHDHIFYGASTGYGKSVVILKFVEKMVKKGKRVLILAPRRKLIRQLTETLSDTYPSVLLGADTIYNKDSSVFIASSATLHRRLATHGKKYLGKIDYVVVDEAHLHTTGKSYESIKKYYWESAKWLGMTATPIDNRGYRLEGWDYTMYNHQTQDLIELGALTPFKVLVEDKPKGLENVGVVGGDYNEGELAEFMSDEARVNNVYEVWQKHAKKKHTLIFAVNIAHAEIIQSDFTSKGVKCGIVHSGIPESDNEHTLSRFKKGKIKVIVNVGMITIGVDLPITDCLILARPTKSLPLALQIYGRGCRLYKGKKHCLILDLAGLVAEKGYPSRRRDFNRVRPPKGANDPQAFQDITCPFCEYEFQAKSARREVIEDKLFITKRAFCPSCNEMYDENVVETKEIQRLKLVEDYTNTSKVTAKEVGALVENVASYKGYKPGWVDVIAKKYNNDETFQEELKMLVNKYNAQMIKLTTVANNIRKLQATL